MTGAIRHPPCCFKRCPRVQTRTGETPSLKMGFANPVLPCLCWRILSFVRKLQQSRTVPAIVRRNSKNYAAPPAPTEVKAIFTPGPMVEEIEIFFM